MNRYIYILLVLSTSLWLAQACQSNGQNTMPQETTRSVQTEDSSTLEARIPPPLGFIRPEIGHSEFGYFLRQLILHPPNTPVRLYNGMLKSNQRAHHAVIDFEVGTRDLQQCADAIIRLHAEYVYAQMRFDDIRYPFTNGFNAEYRLWRQGHRIRVRGNDAFWTDPIAAPSNDHGTFRSYLDMVFAYAGTLSLAKQLKPVNLSDLRIGDVFIQGGSPGHAVLVVDLAIRNNDNDKVFLLAQSFMPAQQIHVLRNPSNTDLSPWYAVGEIDDVLQTPEWTFRPSDLRGFE